MENETEVKNVRKEKVRKEKVRKEKMDTNLNLNYLYIING